MLIWVWIKFCSWSALFSLSLWAQNLDLHEGKVHSSLQKLRSVSVGLGDAVSLLQKPGHQWYLNLRRQSRFALWYDEILFFSGTKPCNNEAECMEDYDVLGPLLDDVYEHLGHDWIDVCVEVFLDLFLSFHIFKYRHTISNLTFICTAPI